MSDLAQKLPFAKSLNELTEAKAGSAIQLLGKSLPASVVEIDATNTIVTIKFEVKSIFTLPQVTCPVAGIQYIRYPITAGDLGVAFAADAYLGGMSGLGGGLATMTALPNLATLVWFPIGNTTLDPTDNVNATVIYGPDGVIIRNNVKPAPTARIAVDGEGNVTIFGAKSVSTDIGGYGSRTTYNGGTSWTVDLYDQGATVTTNHLPINPPQIPAPS